MSRATPAPRGTVAASGDGAGPGLLKMRELAAASGVSAGTIKHYLREGLLPEPVKTSRNMAYYPPEYVDRIRLIKRLQEDRFMPLKVIRGMLDEDPERAAALVELEDRILERALERRETARVSAAEIRRRYRHGVRRVHNRGGVEPRGSGRSRSHRRQAKGRRGRSFERRRSEEEGIQTMKILFLAVIGWSLGFDGFLQLL